MENKKSYQSFVRRAIEWQEKGAGFESLVSMILLSFCASGIAFGLYKTDFAFLSNIGFWVSNVASGVLSYIIAWRVSHLFLQNSERIRVIVALLVSLLFSSSFSFSPFPNVQWFSFLLSCLVFLIVMLLFFARILIGYHLEEKGWGLIGRASEIFTNLEYIRKSKKKKTIIKVLKLITRDEETYDAIAPLLHERSYLSLKQTLGEISDKDKLSQKNRK